MEFLVLIDRFFLAFAYLLTYAPAINPLSSAEYALALTAECGYKHDIDPLIGAIIIQHESGGHEWIVNKVTNDTGLMQIKPAYGFRPDVYEELKTLLYTGDKKAMKKLHATKYTPEQLKDPWINIEVGCWTLKKWQTDWSAGKPEEYIAHYADGTKIKKRGYSFSKWVLHRKKKFEKMYRDMGKELDVAVSQFEKMISEL